MLPPPPLGDLRRGILEPQPHAAHIDGHDLIERVDRIVGNRFDLAFNTGVGQQDIDPAELLDRGLNVLLCLVGLGNISGAIAHRITPNGPDRFFERVLV